MNTFAATDMQKGGAAASTATAPGAEPGAPPSPSEQEESLDQRRADEARDSGAALVVASLVADTALAAREHAMHRDLRLLEAKLQHVTDPRDAFPASGFVAGRQRSAHELAQTPEELAKLALDPGGPKGFHKTKARMLTLLATALQAQLSDEAGLATLSVNYIVTGYGRRAYDVVRACLIPVRTWRRGAGLAGCSKYNAFAALVFMYRVMLTQQDDLLRRKLFRRTALYLPFAHKALLEIAAGMPALRPEHLIGNFQARAKTRAKSYQ